jgi:hypothetical protein
LENAKYQIRGKQENTDRARNQQVNGKARKYDYISIHAKSK